MQREKSARDNSEEERRSHGVIRVDRGVKRKRSGYGDGTRCKASRTGPESRSNLGDLRIPVGPLSPRPNTKSGTNLAVPDGVQQSVYRQQDAGRR